jgi:hypothetical protein
LYCWSEPLSLLLRKGECFGSSLSGVIPMPAVWRIRFTWVFAILFGGLSAMGEGLHLLPGQGHDVFCHGHDDCCCDDDCGICHNGDCSNQAQSPLKLAAAQLTTGTIQAAPGGPTHEACDGSCAICKFFGQAIWFTQTASVPNWEYLLRFQPPIKKVVVVCRWEHLPFLSRAPPAIEAC